MKSRKLRLIALLAMGAIPLQTVSTCNYGPGGYDVFFEQGDWFDDDCCWDDCWGCGNHDDDDDDDDDGDWFGDDWFD